MSEKTDEGMTPRQCYAAGKVGNWARRFAAGESVVFVKETKVDETLEEAKKIYGETRLFHRIRRSDGTDQWWKYNADGVCIQSRETFIDGSLLRCRRRHVLARTGGD